MTFETPAPEKDKDENAAAALGAETNAISDEDTGPEKRGGRFSSLNMRREGAERAVEYLEQSGLAEIFSSDQKKSEWLQVLTQETLAQTLDDIYSRLSGIPTEKLAEQKHSASVYEGGHIAYVPPNLRTQQQIIDRVFLPAIKHMEPVDAALYMGLGINLLHQYPDGNGRLARTMHMLLLPGNDDLKGDAAKERLKLEIISNENTINGNPSFIESEVDDILFDSIKPESVPLTKENLTVVWPFKLESGNYIDIPEPGTRLDHARQDIGYILEDDRSDFFMAAVRFAGLHKPELLTKMEKAEDNHMNSDTDKTQNPAKYMLSITKLFDSLQTPEDCRDFFGSYQVIKALRFKVFADIILNPQKFPLPDAEGQTLKDLLKYRMLNQYAHDTGHRAGNLGYTM